MSNSWAYAGRICGMNEIMGRKSKHAEPFLTFGVMKCLKARFHCERGMEYSLFRLLIFLLRLARKEVQKINKTNKECSIPRW